MPTGLILYGWCSKLQLHWYNSAALVANDRSLPILGTFIFGLGTGIVFVSSSSNLLIPVCHPKLSHRQDHPSHSTNFRGFHYLCSFGTCRGCLFKERGCNFAAALRSFT